MTNSDINFSADDAHRFLPWLTGTMVGLAALLLCLSLSLNAWVLDRSGVAGGGFAVHVPASEDQARQVEALRVTLQKMPGVKSVRPLSEEQLHRLLRPWLGGGDYADLPLPAVIEVTLDDPQAPVDHAALQKTLSAVAPGVEADTHERWTAAFSSFSSAVRALALLLSLLVIGAMAVTIAMSARASLKLHARTVGLLHAIGAEDGYIARQFQREALRLSVPGALAGCAAAGVVYAVTGAYLNSLDLSLLPPLPVTASHLLLLLALPLACGLLAWTVVRVSVLRQLERSL